MKSKIDEDLSQHFLRSDNTFYRTNRILEVRYKFDIIAAFTATTKITLITLPRESQI